MPTDKMGDVTISTREMDEFLKKLKTLPRSVLPNAVRNTLNSLAFDVKTITLPKSAKKNFVNRQPNFFKANSSVKKASGFNLKKMHSIVGMSEDKLKDKSTNYSVKDLEKQEEGGKINSKSFIPMRQARVGNSTNRNVRRTASMQTINSRRITPTNSRSSKSRKQQFIRAAIYSVTKGDGLVLGHKTQSGGRTLFKIDGFSQNVKSRKFRMKFTPLYNVKKNRDIKVNPTHFMEEATKKTLKYLPSFFKEASEFQIKKHLKV